MVALDGMRHKQELTYEAGICILLTRDVSIRGGCRRVGKVSPEQRLCADFGARSDLAMFYGNTGTILNVDLSTKQAVAKGLDTDIARRFLGGLAWA